MKIRTKLTIVVIAILILSVVATIVPIYVKSGGILMDSKHESVSGSVDSIKVEMSETFDRFLRDLKIIMTDREVVNLMKIAKFTKKYDSLLEKIGLVKTLMGYDEIQVFDRKGRHIRGDKEAALAVLPEFAVKMEKGRTVRRLEVADGIVQMMFYGSVYYKNQFLGTLALKKNIDPGFLSSFNHSSKAAVAVFEKNNDGYTLRACSDPERFAGVEPVPSVWAFPRFVDGYRLGREEGVMNYSMLNLGEDPERFILGFFEDKHEVLAVHSQILGISLVMGSVSLVLGCAAVFLFAGTLAAPLKEVARFSKRVAAGDLSRTLPIRRKDEIGDLSVHQNFMVNELSALMNQVVKASGNLEASSGELFCISDIMAEESRKMSDQNGSIMEAAERLSAGMGSVAETMDLSTGNVAEISRAAREMKAELEGIAAETNRAGEITEGATQLLGTTLSSIDKFDVAAREIDSITGTITEISARTRLLALNATIESTRAGGGSGAGFSVLAREIKELAGHTAEATDHIRKKVEGVHVVSSQVRGEMENFVESIHQVHTIVHDTVARVHSQNRATAEIADHVDQVSGGIAGVNRNMARSSRATENISRDIGFLNEVSTRITSNSGSVKQSAETLTGLAGDLAALVGRFSLAENVPPAALPGGPPGALRGPCRGPNPTFK